MKKERTNFSIKKMLILVKYDLIYFKPIPVIPLIVGIGVSIFLLVSNNPLNISFDNRLFDQIWLFIAMLSTIELIFKFALIKENEYIYRHIKTLPVNNFYIFLSNLICSYFNLLVLYSFSIFLNLLLFGLHNFMQLLPSLLNNIMLSIFVITIIYIFRINGEWDILLKSFLILFFGLIFFLKLSHKPFLKMHSLFIYLETNHNTILLALFILTPFIIFLGYTLFDKKFCYRKY